ncbi:hypothetical protein AGMMS49982_00850 [Bacteroidia bacterium]|nr:hypothetical protein AGMMS49982_00850 [Bacteroidia bacterium]
MFKRIGISAILCVAAMNFAAAGLVKKTFSAGDFERKYLIYTPNNPQYSQPSGILVCLHGLNSTMNDFFDTYNVSKMADAMNFIVLAPQALPEQSATVINTASLVSLIMPSEFSLNAVWGCGLKVKVNLFGATLFEAVLNSNVDDTEFINSLINSTLRTYPTAASNVFMLGTSMGGYMSYQFAVAHGEKLSGLISLAGSMGLSINPAGNKAKVPICDFHSTTDEVVPYSGAMEQAGATIYLAKPKSEVIQYWVANNSAGAPVSENVHNYSSNNGVTVEKITYPSAKYEVIHYKMTGAEHSRFLRKASGDCMDHIEEITKFIVAHAASNPTGIDIPTEQPELFYPNPARDVVYFAAEAGNVTIYDLTGRVILSNPFCLRQLDVSSLPSGVYIMSIQSDGIVRTSKLVKR